MVEVAVMNPPPLEALLGAPDKSATSSHLLQSTSGSLVSAATPELGGGGLDTSKVPGDLVRVKL